MKKKSSILILTFVFSYFMAFAHKDRIEWPQTYEFVFQNNEKVRLHNPSDSILKAYSDDISNGKKALINARFIFSTGETLTFKKDNIKWIEMKISKGKQVVIIPNSSIENFSEIHFPSVALLWDGNIRRAFNSRYLYIQFDVNTEKNSDNYSEISLDYSNQKYFQSIFWQ